jgi:hypothetical protein
MKKYLLTVLILYSVSVFGQFKDPPFKTESPSDGITNNNSNMLFGFINTNNFSMRHSFGLSYSTFGGNGTSLATYTNSMMYKFSNDMNLQLDASFVTSPYSSYGKEFQNSLQGIYISRAAFNYRPWDDVYISLQYRNVPNYFLDPYYQNGYFGNRFYQGYNAFYRDPFSF